jgi:hypothetical protein
MAAVYRIKPFRIHSGEFWEVLVEQLEETVTKYHHPFCWKFNWPIRRVGITTQEKDEWIRKFVAEHQHVLIDRIGYIGVFPTRAELCRLVNFNYDCPDYILHDAVRELLAQ